MTLERIETYLWRFDPGPLDVHAHPRVFDPITQDDFIPLNGGREGKAGLQYYTEVAIRSGIVAMLAMPNESIRLFDLCVPERTTLEPYPIASLDTVRPMQAAISHEAYIPTGIHMGIDPETAYLDEARTRLDTDELEKRFTDVSDECVGLKLYLAETTGGYNVPVHNAPGIIGVWDRRNHGKPTTIHVENDHVARVLGDIARLKGGRDIPLHIAHVSSRQELEGVIEAKQAGMNVTCEVTPHHLFLDETVREEIGGYGCMKPSLKSQEDVDFLWAHMRYIDMFASDCAPHRRSDKEAEKPAYGVTNHQVMLPLLLGAVAEGRLTMDDVYQKCCVQPRTRFNLPLADGSHVDVRTDRPEARLRTPEHYEREDKGLDYGFSPFSRLNRHFHLAGEVVAARAGVSEYRASEPSQLQVSRTHLIRPRNLGRGE